ncbi:hypothetical protein ANN_24345 [Periplaneta americana]|uniref:Uncharacterized protein n=1 Tax=Periplaneta americana TaxID=6978 RepID=A0ABQ8S370_PERAM|nr:hypothetical protein ANN_24345 [Periplaneta americana]
MSPGSSTESYPAFAHIGLRENPGKSLNQVTCPDRESNPGHLVSRPDSLTGVSEVVLQTSRDDGEGHMYQFEIRNPGPEMTESKVTCAMSEGRKDRRRTKNIGQGAPLKSQAREMVCIVIEYFEREKGNGGPLLSLAQVVMRTAASVKINKNTVIDIGKEKDRVDF